MKKDRDTVLIVEDDRDVAELLSFHLEDIGLRSDWVSDGRAGLEKAGTGEYALVILDLMLPRLDGIEVCRRVRERDVDTPILMLTARSDEIDKVLGLELGADDYVTKPFSIRELLARVKALLRRRESAAGEGRTAGVKDRRPLHFEELTVEPEKRRVTLSGELMELTVKEFELLALLARNPGRTFSRGELLDLVWGYRFEGYDHTISSHMNRLRSKIEKDPSHPRYLKTVWGIGYRFAEPSELA